MRATRKQACLEFSIITPSFMQPEWLRLCLMSVADQCDEASGRTRGDASPRPLRVEHIVQDACSGESVAAVCRTFPGVRLYQEADDGMYDAVNRGLRRSSGTICAYLNCDEQYLPGTLRAVADYFDSHPQIDVVFGDVVVVDERGGYMCSRQVVRPHRYHTQVVQLNTFTAATFFRRRILDQNLFFDRNWRNPGDAAWVIELLRSKVNVGVMRRYLSAFVDNGANMNLSPASRREIHELRALAPRWARTLTPVWVGVHRLRRLLLGLYNPEPFSYEIYTTARSSCRTRFKVDRPTPYWRNRMA